MNILLIDNYDSFTYNLVQYIRQLSDLRVSVQRNDAVDLTAVEDYDGLVFSPGPGIPAEAGQMPELIRRFAGRLPMLGICLGHQAIAECFGARLRNLEAVQHGLATEMEVLPAGRELFADLPSRFPVGRYHSWVVDSVNLPACLEVLAVDAVGEIMALRHREYDLLGLQFHPESILTPAGLQILQNYFSQRQQPARVLANS